MSANMVYASTNEALNKILSVIAEAYGLPGADTDILDFLQDAIVTHIQNQARKAGQQAFERASSDMGSDAMAGMPGMNPGGVAMKIAPGGGAGNSGFGMPNPDELRRVLGATGATQ